MGKSSIIFDLEDPRSEAIAEVMSNKTSKKILSLLAEKEMSSSEVAEKLGLPLNTVTYNVDKLVKAGLIEKSSKIFWSSRGRRMELYKVSNKRIIIFPKMMIKGILPAIFVTCLIAVLIAFSFGTNFSERSLSEDSFRSEKFVGEDFTQEASLTSGVNEAESAPQFEEARLREKIYDGLADAPNAWAWYLIGALTALVVVILWNLRKKE